MTPRKRLLRVGHLSDPDIHVAVFSQATATRTKLDRPGGIALDASGNLYVADTHNQRVRVVYR